MPNKDLNKDPKDLNLLKPAVFHNYGALICHLSIISGTNAILFSFQYFTSLSIEETTMTNPNLKYRYTELSNLTLLVRSSRRMVSNALEAKFGDSNPISLSYLLLSLSAKEYCYATSLAIDRFSPDEFETIACYHSRIVNQNPDHNLLLFSALEIPEILEFVGSSIRSTVCAEELFIVSI
jgi:hypothetical protein